MFGVVLLHHQLNNNLSYICVCFASKKKNKQTINLNKIINMVIAMFGQCIKAKQKFIMECVRQ